MNALDYANGHENMRQININVYKYSELSERAKEAARQDCAAANGYLNADDAFKSIKALARHFNGSVAGYEVDFFDCSYSSMSFAMPDEDVEEIKSRLNELGSYNTETLKGNGDCKLTGVCYDEDAIDGFRKAWHEGERNIDKLMEAAFRSWLKACQADCEDFYREGDSFADFAEANEYEYYENGTPF